MSNRPADTWGKGWATAGNEQEVTEVTEISFPVSVVSVCSC